MLPGGFVRATGVVRRSAELTVADARVVEPLHVRKPEAKAEGAGHPRDRDDGACGDSAY
jgi:hypothetical protein